MFVLRSFWWLYGIPLHRYTMVCVSVPIPVDPVGVGFLSWLLWTELVGALVLGFLRGHALPCILGRHLGVAWLGLWVRSCLTFWGTVGLFSKAHGPFQCMWFPCLGPSPPRGPLTLVIVCVCFTQREVVSHYGFDLCFPNACYPSIFSCLIGCLHVSFGEICTHILIVFLVLSWKSALYILDARFLIRYVVCKHFRQRVGWFFTLDGLLWSTNVFNFGGAQFVFLLSSFPVSRKTIAYSKSERCVLLYISKSFLIVALTCGSVICFDFIFV